jgi:hypothetical protein
MAKAEQVFGLEQQAQSGPCRRTVKDTGFLAFKHENGNGLTKLVSANALDLSPIIHNF